MPGRTRRLRRLVALLQTSPGNPARPFLSSQALRKCLAAGADVDAGSEEGYTPLVYAVRYRLSGCVATLLAAAADPDAADGYGWTALHHATYEGCEVRRARRRLAQASQRGDGVCSGPAPHALAPRSQRTPLRCSTLTVVSCLPPGPCPGQHTGWDGSVGPPVRITPPLFHSLYSPMPSLRVDAQVSMPALLAAGASPTAVVPRSATTPLHWAAAHGSTAAVALLLRAAPATAACRDMHGKTPLALALACQRAAAARCLMEHAPLPPAGELLPAMSSFGDAMQPLYATLAARQPLSTGQWALVPSPCAGLGAALPAVLQRSTVEASLLVRRLPPADRGRLHTFALCLARAQRRRRKRRRPRLPPLPTPILWRLLALSLTE